MVRWIVKEEVGGEHYESKINQRTKQQQNFSASNQFYIGQKWIQNISHIKLYRKHNQ